MCEGVVCWVCVCACVGCVCAPVRLAIGQNAILGLIATYSSQWKGKEFCTQGFRARKHPLVQMLERRGSYLFDPSSLRMA